MSEEKIVTYIFMWHSLSDACPKCQALNGREWHDQDLFQDVLWDPIWGDLWDLNTDQRLTHPNCRCQLEVRAEFSVREMEEFVELETLLGWLGFG